MKIPQTIIDEMLAHAREGYPNEVCGLIAGKNGLVSRIFRTTNIDESSISYMMEPAEQFHHITYRAFVNVCCPENP